MSSFKASSTVESGQLQVTLNNSTVLTNNGNVVLELEDGKTYVIQWFVSGSRYSHYSIKVDSPKEAIIDLTKILKDGLDYGGYRFIA